MFHRGVQQNMYQEPIIKKIPGDILSPPERQNQGYIDDLSKKRKFELIELLERQTKLLANKAFISKLPDKGEKITSFQVKILKELDHRNEVEDAANLLSRLNIASEGKLAMNELEWTGEYSNKRDITNVDLDSDDDEDEDPLKILAQPTGSGVHKKKVIHLEPVESLIKPEDLEEINSFEVDEAVKVEEHIKYIVDKVEHSKEENSNKRESFKPYKTTKSDVHDPLKEKNRKKGKYWEVTAATPPSSVHGTVKPLSFQESLELQKLHAVQLQKIQAKRAVERLTEQLGLHSIGATLPLDVGNYRSLAADDSNSSSSEDEEEKEVHDEEHDDNAGTVVFKVDSIDI